MASVQELLLAAKAQQSPFMSLMEGVAQGFGQAQSGAMERTKTLMAMDQARQQQEHQAEMQKKFQTMITGQQDKGLKQRMSDLNSNKTLPEPALRLESITQDESGKLQARYGATQPKPKEVSYQKAEYVGKDGKTYSGRFNQSTGETEQRPTDSPAPKTLAETQAATGKILPAASAERLTDGQSVANLMPDVEKAIASNKDIFGPVVGRIGGANPYDTRAQTVNAEMKQKSQIFGKFIEGGVLRKEDEIKYEKMFPQTKDTVEVAQNKLLLVRRMLAQKYEDIRKSLGGSGYDMGGFGELKIPASLFDGESQSSSAIALTGSGATRLAELRKKQQEGRLK